jgi:hypothetical protein
MTWWVTSIENQPTLESALEEALGVLTAEASVGMSLAPIDPEKSRESAPLYAAVIVLVSVNALCHDPPVGFVNCFVAPAVAQLDPLTRVVHVDTAVDDAESPVPAVHG